MPIYAYCIVSNESATLLNGILEKPIRFIAFDELYLVVSEFSAFEIPNIPLTEALRHDEVVTFFLKDNSVLPLRWMTLFESEEDCMAMLQKNQFVLREKLQYFENLVEFGLKVIFPNEAPDFKQNLPEINLKNKKIEDYLKAKLQKYQTNQTKDQFRLIFEQSVKEFIYPHIKDIQLLPPTPTIDWQVVFLIEKNKIEIFRQNIEFLRHKYINLRLMTSGAWAAYHFVALKLNL